MKGAITDSWERYGKKRESPEPKNWRSYGELNQGLAFNVWGLYVPHWVLKPLETQWLLIFYEVLNITVFILQMGKLKYREVKEAGQSLGEVRGGDRM